MNNQNVMRAPGIAEYVDTDPNTSPTVLTQSAALAATGAGKQGVLLGQDRYAVFKFVVPKNQALLLHNMAPFLQRRVAVGQPSETVELITSPEAFGFFSFNLQIDGKSPVVFETNLARPQIGSPAAGTPNNADRNVVAGVPDVSNNPYIDAQKFNPMYSFAIPGGASLEVIMTVLSPASANPLPANGRFVVPTAANPNPVRRVDYAGACIFCTSLPQNAWKDIQKRAVGVSR